MIAIRDAVSVNTLRSASKFRRQRQREKATIIAISIPMTRRLQMTNVARTKNTTTIIIFADPKFKRAQRMKVATKGSISITSLPRLVAINKDRGKAGPEGRDVAWKGSHPFFCYSYKWAQSSSCFPSRAFTCIEEYKFT